MYTLLRQVRPRSWLLLEAPSLGISLILAEIFFKFHSFSLECIAFLATWCMISSGAAFLSGRLFERPIG
jgi:hypothetical protein